MFTLIVYGARDKGTAKLKLVIYGKIVAVEYHHIVSNTILVNEP